MAINGVLLDNRVKRISRQIQGAGSLLTLKLLSATDGGSEVFLFDDIRLDGTQVVVEPGSLALLLGGGLTGLFVLARRRRESRRLDSSLRRFPSRGDRDGGVYRLLQEGLLRGACRRSGGAWRRDQRAMPGP